MIHEMKLNEEPFEKIKSGSKTIELRLYDEKRRKISIGDFIKFYSVVDMQEMTVRVTGLHIYDDFEKLYQNLPLEKCGYDYGDVKKAKAEDMEKYYSKAEQKKYGVVGIELQLL